MEKEYIVYLHINSVNKKVYVGITHHVDNPNRRWGEGHLYKHSIKFYNAIKKYGWDNFDHIVLCSTSKQKAILLEKTLIRFYKRKKRSYNIANGGEGSSSFSKETKIKLSKVLKGRVRKKESIKATVITRRLKDNYSKYPYWLWRDMKGVNNPMFGKRLSEESKAKKYKKVLQFDKDGNFIREFNSIKEAAKDVNISSTQLVAALRGRSKTAAKYIWRYKYE